VFRRRLDFFSLFETLSFSSNANVVAVVVVVVVVAAAVVVFCPKEKKREYE
jgi:hypothetical protein